MTLVARAAVTPAPLGASLLLVSRALKWLMEPKQQQQPIRYHKTFPLNFIWPLFIDGIPNLWDMKLFALLASMHALICSQSAVIICTAFSLGCKYIQWMF